MPPRVFMPIRHRRRQSEPEHIDPHVKRMTRGSLLVGLGFLVILAGVLVTIFAMKPNTARYRRPLRTFVVGGGAGGGGQTTPPPSRTPVGRETPGGNGKTPGGSDEEETESGFNVSAVLGPTLAVVGVTTSLAGAIYYAVNYQRKKQKDKEASRQAADDEAPRESSPMEGSPSEVNRACTDVTTSASDIQLNAKQTSECL